MTKTNRIIVSISALLSGLASAGSPPAGKAPMPAATPSASPFTGSITAGYDSQYLYRGYEILSATGEKARNLIWGALDLNLALSDRVSWNFNAWYADSASVDYTELDLYTRLGFKVNDALTIGPSFKYYDYPDYASTIDQQFEVGVEAFITPCANTSIYLGAFYETEAEQFYYELGANYTVKLSDSFSLVPGAVVSFIDVTSSTFGLDESGVHHAAAYVRAPISFGKAVLTPYIQANFPLGDQVDSVQDDIIFGGVSLAFSF